MSLHFKSLNSLHFSRSHIGGGQPRKSVLNVVKMKTDKVTIVVSFCFISYFLSCQGAALQVLLCLVCVYSVIKFKLDSGSIKGFSFSPKTGNIQTPFYMRIKIWAAPKNFLVLVITILLHTYVGLQKCIRNKNLVKEKQWTRGNSQVYAQLLSSFHFKSKFLHIGTVDIFFRGMKTS